MAETATEVSTIGLVDTTQRARRPKRRQWTEGFKRQIVAETLEPGASVSIVAPEQPPAAEQSITMLPVTIAPEASEPRPRARRSGTIDITLAGGARVCVRGEVSSETLRQVIELLR